MILPVRHAVLESRRTLGESGVWHRGRELMFPNALLRPSRLRYMEQGLVRFDKVHAVDAWRGRLPIDCCINRDHNCRQNRLGRGGTPPLIMPSPVTVETSANIVHREADPFSGRIAVDSLHSHRTRQGSRKNVFCRHRLSS